MLKYIVTIDGQSGQVLNVMLPQAVIPDHKSSNVHGHIAIHVTKELLDSLPEADESNLHTLVREHWYDIENDKFIYIGLPPNQYASYNPDTGGWSFDIEMMKSDIRGQRNKLLADTDWTQIPDAPLSGDEKLAFATYRQELRDLMNNLGDEYDDLANVTWPTLS